MKHLPYMLVTMALLVLAGCTAPGEREPTRRLPTDAEVEQYNALVPQEEHIVCRMEASVQTNIPRRVCRLVRDIEETSVFHREQLRRVLQ